jgi:hypothetical protein
LGLQRTERAELFSAERYVQLGGQALLILIQADWNHRSVAPL